MNVSGLSVDLADHTSDILQVIRKYKLRASHWPWLDADSHMLRTSAASLVCTFEHNVSFHLSHQPLQGHVDLGPLCLRAVKMLGTNKKILLLPSPQSPEISEAEGVFAE